MNLSRATICLFSVGLAATLTACIAEGDADFGGLTETTTDGASSSGAEAPAYDPDGEPHAVEPAASNLRVHEPTEGSCPKGAKEYFQIRTGLGGHSFAIDVDGNVYGWGANDKGQLGINSVSTTETKPKKVSTTQKFWDVAAGDKHTLALANDGTVWGWGDNSAGQIANATTSVPKKIAGLGGVVQIAAGGRFSLALTDQGKLYAWGDNTYGQLGIGSVGGTRTTPTLVSSVTSPAAIGAGRDFAAAHKGSQLWIWGRDNVGQLGNGPASTASRGTPSPVALPGIYGFGLGPEHVLVYTAQSLSSYHAWGSNLSGQLGDGTLSQRTSPVAITGPSFLSVSQLIAGATSTFITGATGFSPPKPGIELYSAGRNDYRQLLNTAPSPTKSFTEMSGVLQEGYDNGVSHGYLQQVAAGNGYTLMLIGTAVKSIGINNAGQLGDGTLISRSSPTNVCLP
ncbi:RCC1 domain-containing protein [Nannocystis punicea]|uniref:RCC1-like domain-containing protein n=1 Tax=Nannocystis punicea TaxID=2995304 RepID=A0ABY7H2H5_9BACT|nr:hypothetical protein [Nannocystis poenicansa]WAS93432.1 hypothetical protein O0S08_45385 [Nannocystis poenicansa]